ncbi:hypothetical protein R1flu_004233 [Riccia fluitans]|uniref:Uncharacterized protein n=1 Tax=Riccia fluitans TaxID=41844 RepID=A0ABD1YSN3_9MARC
MSDDCRFLKLSHTEHKRENENEKLQFEIFVENVLRWPLGLFYQLIHATLRRPVSPTDARPPTRGSLVTSLNRAWEAALSATVLRLRRTSTVKIHRPSRTLSGK